MENRIFEKAAIAAMSALFKETLWNPSVIVERSVLIAEMLDDKIRAVKPTQEHSIPSLEQYILEVDENHARHAKELSNRINNLEYKINKLEYQMENILKLLEEHINEKP